MSPAGPENPPSLKSRIDAIVRTGLLPGLKAAGFKKNGRTFRLEHSDHVRIVAVIGGSHNVNMEFGSVGSFAVHLGLFFPGPFAVDGVELRRAPGIHECDLNSQLRSPTSRWGQFDYSDKIQFSDAERAATLSADWADFGPTWFAENADHRTAFSRLREAGQWREALYFAIHLKEMDAARECLEGCRQSLGGMTLDYVIAIARKNGVE